MSNPRVVIDAPEWKIRRLKELREQRAEKAVADYTSPLALRRGLDPRTVVTPALQLIDDLLMDVLAGAIERLIIDVPPQEGKSTLVGRGFPCYVLKDNPDTRIVSASYEQRLANRNGRAVRNDITSNPQLGLRVAADTSAAHEWGIADHEGGMYAVGMGGQLTGRPADLLLIDDPVKDRAQAESEAYRNGAWEWWTDTARPRLAPGAAVVLIMTRWHEDDLAGRLIARSDEEWTVVNIPALADHDPHKGETDALSRQPGEWLESARRRTSKQWEATRAAVGERTFASLYQGRPAPVEGDLFKRSQWGRYDSPRAALQDDGTWSAPAADEVIQSWDMAFKDTKASDYVVGQVWARYGNDAYLLDQIRERMSFTATCAALVELTRKWPQARAKLVEDKANGSAVINQLKSTVTGLIPINPGSDSKYVRALAISPFVESGHVYLPTERLASWAAGFIEEAAAFPNSVHDDQVDAATQAVTRLLGRPHGPVDVATAANYRSAARMPRVIGAPSGRR